jgi:hypothetical protein
MYVARVGKQDTLAPKAMQEKMGLARTWHLRVAGGPSLAMKYPILEDNSVVNGGHLQPFCAFHVFSAT